MPAPTFNLALLLSLLLCLFLPFTAALPVDPTPPPGMDSTVDPKDGPGNLSAGRRLYQSGLYDAAAMHYWRAVLFHGESSHGAYSVEDAFGPFVRCYSVQGRTADGFVFVATESVRRGQAEMGKVYLESALEVDPEHEGALEMKKLLESGGLTSSAVQQQQQRGGGDGGSGGDATTDADGKSPEDLYSVGTVHFSDKKYALAAEAFQKSCQLSNARIGVACTNAVYCRTNILDWGPEKGAQFDRDMLVIESITRMEVAAHRTVDLETGFVSWRKSTSAHPHMMLGYPVNSTLKRYVAESYAAMDEMLARVNDAGTGVADLPSDLPFDQDDNRARYVFEAHDAGPAGLRIKVGFVASGFNSKAVLYLSHDIFRFFDPQIFEVHIFSLGPPDNPGFIKHAMRGVDWRERVKSTVDVFHDVQHLKNDHVSLARYIHAEDVHVLIEWDGYARQGERAQGLFALRPAPVQILHQEFLGTSGAQYVDYIVTDRVSSPEHLEGLYTEKFLYMPNHFFSKGHAMQKEVKKPTYDYTPAKEPYQLGTGSPQENRCLSPLDMGPETPSFVFCNFNKFLKNNPETLLSWIKILQSVPGSMLCLLENPTEGVPYLRKFVNEAGGGGDSSADLNARIHFLPWQANPFDHQMRAQDFCNVMLDSHPYNGHTTAQDSLYGGVPIVTRADGDDMSSRVSTSANIVLELSDLNAERGASQYEDIAIKLGKDEQYYQSIRTKLIDTCLQKNPMHPYWDVPRYTKNLETGLKGAWEAYLSGKPAAHIDIEESDETKKGTSEVDIARLEAARRESKKEKASRETARSGEL